MTVGGACPRFSKPRRLPTGASDGVLRVHLILFDIDGTLLLCGRQVKEIFAAALEEVFDRTGELEGYDFSGKTDTQIAGDLLASAGLTAEEIEEGMPRVKEVYLDKLGRELDGEKMRLLAGVEDLLQKLEARADVCLGLLTGNWEQGARIKLSRFDLNWYFPFGAFGDEQTDRMELPPLALERAQEHTGQSFEPAQTVIVGDSVLDVACARAHGIRALAVATGKTPAEELERAGADCVISDLGEFHRGVPLDIA